MAAISKPATVLSHKHPTNQTTAMVMGMGIMA